MAQYGVSQPISMQGPTEEELKLSVEVSLVISCKFPCFHIYFLLISVGTRAKDLQLFRNRRRTSEEVGCSQKNQSPGQELGQTSVHSEERRFCILIPVVRF